MRDRSQFGGDGSWGGEVAAAVHGGFGRRFALGAGTAEFVVGAVPRAFEGGDLALGAGEEPGGGGIREQGRCEGVIGRFGHDGAVKVGLNGFEAAFLPFGTDHGIDVEGFGGGFGPVLVVVLGGEGLVFGGIFAGDDDAGGVDAVFQGVEAGGGLALDGAGSGGLLRIGAVGSLLSCPLKFALRRKLPAADRRRKTA